MSEPTTEARTHIFAGRRGWGHDYCIHAVQDGGKVLDASGWKRGIRTGDTLVLERKGNNDGTVHYRVQSIRYEFDPSDMWHATLEWLPRYTCTACGARTSNPDAHECPTPHPQEPTP